MNSHPIAPGTAARCLNRASYRFGQVGIVAEVVPEAPRDERGRHAPDAPGAHGPAFAWAKYPDGIRNPHDLDRIEEVTA